MSDKSRFIHIVGENGVFLQTINLDSEAAKVVITLPASKNTSVEWLRSLYVSLKIFRETAPAVITAHGINHHGNSLHSLEVMISKEYERITGERLQK